MQNSFILAQRQVAGVEVAPSPQSCQHLSSAALGLRELSTPLPAGSAQPTGSLLCKSLQLPHLGGAWRCCSGSREEGDRKGIRHFPGQPLKPPSSLSTPAPQQPGSPGGCALSWREPFCRKKGKDVGSSAQAKRAMPFKWPRADYI